MESNDKYRDKFAQEEPDVEAHRFVTEDPMGDEADKTKTKTKFEKTKFRSPEGDETERNKF
jgi:hypothetical protein